MNSSVEVLESKEGMTHTVEVLGFPLLAIDLDQATDWLLDRAAAGKGGWCISLNLHGLWVGLRDERLDRAMRSADTFLADGMPLVWFSKIGGSAGLPGRVTGADLTPRLIAGASHRRIPYAVVGGRDPKAAVTRSTGDPQACDIFSESFGKIDATKYPVELVDKLRAKQPRLILIALGSPRQDWLALRLREACPNAVIIGVGSAMDVAAGILGRAPRWMQERGFEWMYRLYKQPRSLALRYLVYCPLVLWRLLLWALRGGG